MANNEDFLKAFKKSIKLIPINIKGNLVNVPITYKMSASKKYSEIYKETKDQKASFLGMVYHIITSYWKVAYDDGNEPDLSIDDLQALSDSDIARIYDSIVSDVNDFQEFGTQLDNKLTTIYEKFYCLHKMEQEKYLSRLSKVAKGLSGTIVQMNTVNMVAPAIQQLASTQLAWQKTLKQISHFNYDYLANAFKVMDTLEISRIAAAQGNMSKSIAIAESQMRSVQPIMDQIHQMASISLAPVDSFRNILKASAIASVRSAFSIDANLFKVVNIQQKALENALKGISRFEFNSKLIELSAIIKDISSNIKPFLIDINVINLGSLNLNTFLQKRSAALKKFRWWFVSDFPMGIANYIFENQGSLSQDEVDAIICNFFEGDDFKELDNLTSRWFQLDYFKQVSKFLNTGIKHHKSGDYISSIPLLAPLIEGIVRLFMSDTYQVFRYRFEPIMDQFKEKANEIDSFISGYAITLIDGFYGSFKPDKPDGTPDFNRNKISHGLSFNYDTKAASLKLILYINEVFEIICAIKGIEL